MTLDFYGENIFRMFQDNMGGIVRDPQASPEARILVDRPRKEVGELSLTDKDGVITVSTARIQVELDKQTSLFKITDKIRQKVVVESVRPVDFMEKQVCMSLKEHDNEYFYGGGVQNGRFSHKGKSIRIVNTNQWTDGGVASPTPFYWSTEGYGVMWYTFRPGLYDFGATDKGVVKLSHEENYLDVFFMVNEEPVALLNDFYQLTGNPVLLPKFGFYEGHLNAYNRDYWKEDEKGILFEDGKKYKESQKDNGGIKESLNGEKNNYQFSARAVIDRYNAADMPLGWILPNDGYGAGYGQTSTLDGNIQNLKELGDYARAKGVEIGLWTQSDLHPKEGIEPLLQRDIVKEVRDAGVRVLKTDVAWVGAGYSFGLNGVADVGQIMPYYGNNARPFIISLDGWAGTQRYAGIWSGDQTGGEWEYIRFHIPTYIGSGLSGQPNISSDMDGIFGGKNVPVNVRDFQWKTFTPMQLNMDGWGANPKYPQALGEPATSINRWYLKMKSEFMPYTYSIAREAIDGKPMIRAMFLDYPNDYTLGTATRYQFLYGPYVLVAPIYQSTQADKEGNDVRNGIYLPEGNWIDYFTGDLYQGGRILNNFEAPLWKLPLFVKQGAILPMTTAHNNVGQMDKHLRVYELYPGGNTEFTEYDDDGVSEAYRSGQYATTRIRSVVEGADLNVYVEPVQGSFAGMETHKSTYFRINVTAQPKKLTARVGGKKVKLTPVASLDELQQGTDVYYYEPSPELNRFATPGSEQARLHVIKNPVVHVKLGETDVTQNDIQLEMKGYVFAPAEKLLVSQGALITPEAEVTEENTGAYALTPSWKKVNNADYYEIEYKGMLYSTIRDTQLLFEDLRPETTCMFKVRAVNASGVSEWASVTATTKSDPLEFAIRGIKGETSCPNQGGQGVNRLFNFDEGDSWHTKWSEEAVPFDLIIDLNSVNQLDKFQYLPRLDAGNDTLGKGTVYYSMDKSNWHEAGAFDWKGSDVKTFVFENHPTARYIKLSVTAATGKYGSGRELYVFKVPGSESYIPGDINQDKLVDENDLTSYMNYTGLRRGDSDFEGYISMGDLNDNGLIDAYDISAVATRLESGVSSRQVPLVAGEISITPSKKTYNEGETVEIRVSGKGMCSVNALSFALPYDPQALEYVETEAAGMKEMRNLTNDRLHTNGTKALYPTFVNIGEKPYLEGDAELMTIKFKAKRKQKIDLKVLDGMLVDKNLNTVKF
ncbi:DUF5110 domain-containing protein [Phocaeicola sp. Sa1YUN3]|uniref:DUF5110 domain-containing protein n=1 Tax=Phocaeicola faecium TaxID=2762213 RepID=A0ABR8VCR7_9BACT|nr:DUF5110 domain-containing protein [Phocaeicola faecium]